MTPSTTPSGSARPAGGASGDAAGEILALRAQLAELMRERDNLVALVDVLQGISGATQYPEILQTIAGKVGASFDLDRCSVFLFSDGPGARLVASYEDPSIRNLEVDLARYPELQRALESGETVLIADVATEPTLRLAWPQLTLRQVRSLLVVPIKWRSSVIGALFLRTRRSLPSLRDDDVRFVQTIASVAARALKLAHRFEALLKDGDLRDEERSSELRRVALLAFVRRLLERVDDAQPPGASEAALDRATTDELDRLASVALTVFDEQAGA
ncbi:MAG: GAF domain-containing protein [Gemmatimonadetes bacterium]|nr:GAF domain-containing protein [Gemmatimonadota bacterium]